MLDRQLQEGTFDLVAVGETRHVVTGGRSFEVRDVDLERPPISTPDLVPAGIDEESMKPGVELLGISKTPELPPGLEQRVLDRILRRIPVAEDPSRDRVQPVVGGGREAFECLVVAPLCAFDELGRHSLPFSVAAGLSRVHPVRRRCSANPSGSVSFPLVTDIDPHADPTPPRPPRPTGPIQYKGDVLEAERGPGLGCFRFQVILLVALIVLTPLSVVWDWPPTVSAILLFIVLLLLLVTGQTIIFLLRLVAADRRGRRRPLASGTPTVGELEDAAGAGESGLDADAATGPAPDGPARAELEPSLDEPIPPGPPV